MIGVLTRESAPSFGRQPGELERTYVDIFNRFARMIAAGDFPFDAEDAETEEAPRVGDGVILLDAAQRVEYTSPNGVSALHRVGVHANSEGLRLGELGLDDTLVRMAFSINAPVTEELEGQADVSVLVRCIPLIDHGAVSGAVVLMRDVSELRRRDRLLLSKDATIREIHHRVKNNLQTISSLLRLQGRRFTSPEAKTAIEESVRRIRAIALVHETLSREAGDDVAFVEIVRPLLRMVEEGMSSEDRPVSFTVEGDAGFLPATVATPLSVVLNELLQNAIDHAFPVGLGPQGRAGPGRGPARQRRGAVAGVGRRRRGGAPAGLLARLGDGPGALDRAHARDDRAHGHDRARAGHGGRRSPRHRRSPGPPGHRAGVRSTASASGDRSEATLGAAAETRTDLLPEQEVG